MNVLINPIIMSFLQCIDDMKESNEELKQKALKEYRDACNLPRKKKKIARKSANLLYSIACWGDDILLNRHK
jgi:hypothetical protein